MKSLIKLFFILLIFSRSIFASSPTLDWQRVELEEKLSEKLNSALLRVFEKNEYILNITTEFNYIKKVEVKNVEEQKDIDQIKENQISPLTKFDIDLYVVDENSKEKQEELNKKNVDDAEEVLNIFQYLTSVNVNLILDDKIEENRVELARNILTILSTKMGKVVPKIKVEKLPLIKVVEKVEEKKPEEVIVEKVWTVEDYLNWLSKFNSLLGLVFASLILGLLAKTSLGSITELGKKGLSFLENNFSKVEEKEEDSAKELSAIEEKQAEAANEENVQLADLRYMQTFLEQCIKFPADAKISIQKWLNINSFEAHNTLAAVVKLLPPEEFKKMMSTLDRKYKKQWKEIVHDKVGNISLVRANEFIEYDSMDNLVLNVAGISENAQEFLSKVRPEDASNICLKDESFGPLFLNIMMPTYIQQMFLYLPEEKIEAFTIASVRFDPATIELELARLKNTLEKGTDLGKDLSSPFIDRLPSLFSNATPAVENYLYSSLVEAGNKDEIYKIAMKLFPSNLLFKLQEETFRNILKGLTLKNRAELIFSLDQDKKDFAIKSLGDEKSKMRELVQVELGLIDTSPERKERVLNDKMLVWSNFLKYSRSFLCTGGAFEKEAESLVKEWINEITKNKTQSPDLSSKGENDDSIPKAA